MRYLLAFLSRLVPVWYLMLFVGLEAAANCDRDKRYRQVAMPIVTVAFALFVLIDTDWVNALSQVLLALVSLRLNMAVAANATAAYALSLNCVYLALVALLKVAYRPLYSMVHARFGDTIDRLTERFYDYDERSGYWLLEERWLGLRQLARNLFICACALSGVLFFIMNGSGAVPGLARDFYPAIMVTIIGEIYYALGGRTRLEQESSLETDADWALRHHSYGKIVKALRHYFGDKVLAVRSSGVRRGSSMSREDFCEELVASDDHARRLAGNYFRTLVRRGIFDGGGDYVDFDRDAALATVSLLEGDSVLFASPFLSDLIPYLFLPVNTFLLRGKHVVFMHAAGDAERDVRAFVERGLAFASGVEGLWSVGHLGPDGAETPDVALMTYDELSDLHLLYANGAYFRDTAFVGVFDPSSLLATYQIPLAVFADLANDDARTVYAFFDINRDGLVDALSHTFRTHLVEVCATEYGHASHIGVFWDADDVDYQHRLFPDVAHYLGVAPEIGLVALKSQASKVTWVAHESVPLADQRWVLGQYHRELFDFGELPQQQAQLDDCFEFVSDPWSLAKEPKRFIMVEDETKNLFEAYRQFATRGTDETFVNVISPSYLLREYMTHNADLFEHDPKAIPSLVPDAPRSERNLLLEFIAKMMATDAGVSLYDDEVTRKLRRIGVRERDARGALERMMRTYLVPDELADGMVESPESLLVATDEVYYDAVADVEQERVRFSLLDRARFSACFQGILSVPLVTEMPDGTMMVLGTRVSGLVCQTLLPGQFTVIDGKYYEVTDISLQTGVVLRRAGDHFSRRRYYRQIREYRFVDPECLRSDREPCDTLTISRFKADVTVHTSGYLELASYSDLSRGRRKSVSTVPDRTHASKTVLKVSLPGASPSVVRTLCVVVSEMLVTLFPKDYPYLAVLSRECNDLPEGLVYHVDDQSVLDDSCLYVVEDSPQDMGLTTAVERNLMRILSICFEFLFWHVEELWTNPVAADTQDSGDVAQDEGDVHQSEDDAAGQASQGEVASRPTLVQRIRAFLRRLVTRIRTLFRIRG